MVIGIYPADEIAACLFVARNEHFPGLQDRVGERQRRNVQDPDVDGHPRTVFQFLLERRFVPERNGCSAAFVPQEDADIDVAECTVEE